MTSNPTKPDSKAARYTELARRYGVGPLPLLEKCELLARRLDAALTALAPLATRTGTCELCGRVVRPYPCWRTWQGEHCVEPELHSGDHWCAWIGWRKDHMDAGVPGELCGAGARAGSGTALTAPPMTCSLPKNHEGPHSLPPVGHDSTCLLHGR